MIAVAYLFQNTKAIAHSDVPVESLRVVPADSLSGKQSLRHTGGLRNPLSNLTRLSRRGPRNRNRTRAQPVVELWQARWAIPFVPASGGPSKTNVAYLAATVANLGVGTGFGDHYSVDLPVIYSPYTVARDYRLRFLAILPEFRYWLGTPMKGHFSGRISISGRSISRWTSIRATSLPTVSTAWG